ncbi:MAG: hypothetical protein ACRDJ1_03800 [Actinomycetota bacterium]
MRSSVALLVPLVAVALTAAPATAQEEAGPADAVFAQIHEALQPLAPVAEQMGDAVGTLQAALVQAVLTAGSQSESLAPLIAQAAEALATFRASAESALAAGSPALELLAGIGDTIGGEIAVATNTLDAAIRERADTLEQLYSSFGPGLSAICEANAQAPLLVGLLPYGYAIGGVFAPLDSTCAGVAPPPAPPTEQLAPLLTQYAAFMEGTGYALEPLAGVLQPAFEPACTFFVLVQTASIFVTLPIPTGPFVDPALSAACAVGQGTSPASPALVFVTVASQPFVPFVEDAAGSVGVLVPAIEPLRPVLDPALAGLCNTLPAAGQLGPLLPFPVPVEPTVFLEATGVLLCAAVDLLPIDDGSPEPSGGGAVPAPVTPLGPGTSVGQPPVLGGTIVALAPPASIPVAAPPPFTRVSTSIGGLSPRLWAPLIPVALLIAWLIGWTRWNAALGRVRAAR